MHFLSLIEKSRAKAEHVMWGVGGINLIANLFRDTSIIHIHILVHTLAQYININ